MVHICPTEMFSYPIHSSIFEPLTKEFEQQFKDKNERAAQLSICLDGDTFFDARGNRNAKCTMDLTMVFSCTKVIESLIIAMLVDRKLLDYDMPIATYWPEFGTTFHSQITVADLMQHRAGLERIPTRLTTLDACFTFSLLESKEKWVLETLQMDEDVKRGECKTRYHPITRGIISDILCERVYGASGAMFVQKEIVAKLPDIAEFYIGCPNVSIQKRISTCEQAQGMVSAIVELVSHTSGYVRRFKHPGKRATPEQLDRFHYRHLKPQEVAFTKRVLSSKSREFQSLMIVNDKGFGSHTLANAEDFRVIPFLSVTGITNATSFARILAELASDTSTLFLSKEGKRAALEADKVGEMDEMIGDPIRYTKCGWSMDYFKPGWIGWAGAGGSVALFSPTLHASFVYIPTKLDSRIHKPHGLRLLDATDKLLRQGQ